MKGSRGDGDRVRLFVRCRPQATLGCEPSALEPRLAEQPVVFGVRTNPEPYDAVGRFDAEHTMVKAHPSRIESTDLLEMERRMTRVALQLLVTAIREALD